MKRLFLALWPDNKTRQTSYRVTECKEKCAGKQVIAENIHVTLVFIGSVDTDCATKILSACEAIKATAFSIQFECLSFWRKPKILCLTSQQLPSELLRLTQDLKQLVNACGVQTDDREYRPHVTLCRKVNKTLELSFQPIVWQADGFCLVESVTTQNGPVYKVIDSWAFSESIALPDNHTM